MLTTPVKGGQTFVSPTYQRRPEAQSTFSASVQSPENLQPVHVQNGKLQLAVLGEIYFKYYIKNEGQKMSCDIAKLKPLLHLNVVTLMPYISLHI